MFHYKPFLDLGIGASNPGVGGEDEELRGAWMTRQGLSWVEHGRKKREGAEAVIVGDAQNLGGL